MICPTCHGEKKLFIPFAFSYEKMKCKPKVLPCISCHETGKVDDRYPEWKKIGDRLYKKRIERHETLRDFCKRTGINVSLRSMQEHGFADPTNAES